MSRWMINARGNQFSAGSMDELKRLAKAGDITSGDILQPPGAAEWIYALEVPELKGSLRAEFDEELPAGPREMSPTVKWGTAAVLALVAAGAWSYALSLRATIPAPGSVQLLGEKGLSFSEVLVTAENAELKTEASETATGVGPLPKDSKAELLAKRGKWYRLRYDGKEGYARVDDVVPAYYFADEEVKTEHDPLYNPDRYVSVANSTWALPPDGAKDKVTIFQFLMKNDSKFVTTDLKLLVTIKNDNDQVLETKELAVEGTIPPNGDTWVGVLKADKKDKTSTDRLMTEAAYEEMAKADPALAERWVTEVPVRLDSDGFAEARIDLLEIRALPREEGAK